jgi:transposase InsO family protein
MGHPSPDTLRSTTQVVEGIPPLPHDTSFFHCPFCDMAKMQKQSGNPTSLRDNFMPGTAYHMDLGFIRGPNNLPDVIKNSATPTFTSQLSHDGYNAYLLIIDAASRYIFCFLLKSKSPPVQIIDQFLAKHGRASNKIITTSPDGALHKSTSFKATCRQYGFEPDTNDLPDNLMTELHLEQHRYTVRTDNGTELAGSQEIHQTINNHGYAMEVTAPDASSQNGMAERPHRTLKERVRCLLYAAGLGIEFWSDALLHAVWLYNRTYHRSIGITPYQ